MRNNFGFLRLFFATLVILSHSPELVDGNRTREILTRIFGTMSFGELSVDGFFLISGYLITKSFESTPSISVFGLKRILRIYPGYLVAFLLSVAFIAPLSGADIQNLSLRAIAKLVACASVLSTPEVDGAFSGLPYPLLNGAMWTIAYEFRCYILAAILGALGFHKKRAAYVALTMLLLAVNASGIELEHTPASRLIGTFHNTARFFGIFMVGGTFYLFRNVIRLEGKLAALGSIALVALMFSARLAETSFAILGGYFLFWFAFQVRSGFLSRIGEKVDLSYGVYLYAWPIQNLLILYNPSISPWILTVMVIPLTMAAAFASWSLVERPSLSLKPKFGNSNDVPRTLSN